jgi:hypothetical protein
MSSCRGHAPGRLVSGGASPSRRLPVTIAVIVALLSAAASCACAGEFEASTAPDGRYLLRIYPKFFFASAYFSDDGRAHNLPGVSGLLYFELPVQVQYGVTGSLSIGAIVPFGWTYREQEALAGSDNRVAVRELWLSVQHKWLTFPFISSSSLRIKVPLANKKDWEDGLHIGDGQVDIYPVYHFDYFNQAHYWYVQFAAGYKYRFKKGSYKPLDETRFYGQGGYELFPDLRMRFYLLADLTRFANGAFPEGDRKVFEQDGSLHSFGYGVSLWPRPTFRVELTTAGDWSGTNQYRGVRWEIGITKIL